MIDEGQVVAFDAYWTGSFRGRSAFVMRDGLLHPVEPDARPDVHVPGTLFPRLTDHHVHLGLIDPATLLDGGITNVVDLGGDPSELGKLRRDAAFPGSTLPEIHFAGAFLTCVGGYPKGRPWAPDAAVLEIAEPDHAEAAVHRQVAMGASVIKVTLNSAAGPVPSADLLAAIVTSARGEGVPVAAHVEGEGMTRLALDAGVNVLAHAPFTERLDADLVARMSRAGTAIVSTLDIHGRREPSDRSPTGGEPTAAFEVATDNLRHLLDAGARVLYGTDLGNGSLPSGVNERELTALASVGLDRDALVASIAGVRHPEAIGPRLAWAPGLPPDGMGESVEESAVQTASWLAGARATTVDYLEDTLQ